MRGYRIHRLSKSRWVAITGSKIALLMPDPLEVRRGSQACEVSGSFGKCGLVWSFPKPPGPEPFSPDPQCFDKHGNNVAGATRSMRFTSSRRYPRIPYSPPFVDYTGVISVWCLNGGWFGVRVCHCGRFSSTILRFRSTIQ
jgi:hypothetical protein